MGFMNIAIDGPSGAGKSTIAKLISKEMGYIYIDTGAMYRAVALKMLNLGIDIKNEPEKVIGALDDTNVDIAHSDSGQLIFLDGEDVTDKIRTPERSSFETCRASKNSC